MRTWICVAALLAAAHLAAAQQPDITKADIKGPDGIVYPDFSRAGIPGGIPTIKREYDATLSGAKPNDDADDGPAIQAAVDKVAEAGGGVVKLPAGTYIIDTPITVSRDDVVIRGEGPERTRLIPRFEGQALAESKPTVDVIRIEPPKTGRRYDIFPDQPIRRGDTQVHVPDAGKVRVGDIVVLTATPPRDVIDMLSPKLRSLATDGSYGSIYSWQYLRVTGKDGQHVRFDRPIRLDMSLEMKPKLMQQTLLSGCGIEDLSIRQSVPKKGISGIMFSSTQRCWLKNVHVFKIGNWPAGWGRSFEFEMRGCEFDESLSRGGGGVAYFGLGFCSDGLVEDCRLTRLRHLSITMGSNGNVFRDCFFENVDINFHMHWPNENLFENCHADSTIGPRPAPGEERRGSYGFGIYTPRYNGDIHNPAGPRNTFYHNDIISDWDGVMLGGGASRHTIVAYNRFDVKKSTAAVVKPGSERSVFIGNVFTLHDHGERRGWMKPQTYGHDNPDSLVGAVLFPAGEAPEGVRFIDNTFYGAPEGKIYSAGEPDVSKGNRGTTAVRRASMPKPPVPSLYQWQKEQRGR